MKIRYLNNVPLLCFVAFLGVVYISNAHTVEKKLRKIEVLKKEVKEEKWKYMEVQTEIIHSSTESQLAKKLNDKEIKINDETPVKLKGAGD